MKSIAEVQARSSKHRQTTTATPIVTPSHWLEAAITDTTARLDALPSDGSTTYQERLSSARTTVDGLWMSNSDAAVETAAVELEQLAAVAGAPHSTSLWLAARALRGARKGPLLARG